MPTPEEPHRPDPLVVNQPHALRGSHSAWPQDTVQGGSEMGAGTIAGPTGDRQPNNNELAIAKHQALPRPTLHAAVPHAGCTAAVGIKHGGARSLLCGRTHSLDAVMLLACLLTCLPDQRGSRTANWAATE